MVDYYVEDILIPLKDIIIPPDYLLPDFIRNMEKKRGKLKTSIYFNSAQETLKKKCVMV